MDGIGSSFSKSNSAPTPMTEEEFLRERGVAYAVSGAGIDRYGGANMTRMSDRQRKRTLSSINSLNDAYYEKREAARKEYQNLVASGKIRDKTRVERIIENAHGHPDNTSTQAARRMAAKMGYDWKTGKKLK